MAKHAIHTGVAGGRLGGSIYRSIQLWDIAAAAIILAEVGGVKTIDEAKKIFADKMDKTSLERIGKIKNEEALLKAVNKKEFEAYFRPDEERPEDGEEKPQESPQKGSVN